MCSYSQHLIDKIERLQGLISLKLGLECIDEFNSAKANKTKKVRSISPEKPLKKKIEQSRKVTLTAQRFYKSLSREDDNTIYNTFHILKTLALPQSARVSGFDDMSIVPVVLNNKYNRTRQASKRQKCIMENDSSECDETFCEITNNIPKKVNVVNGLIFN